MPCSSSWYNQRSLDINERDAWYNRAEWSDITCHLNISKSEVYKIKIMIVS